MVTQTDLTIHCISNTVPRPDYTELLITFYAAMEGTQKRTYLLPCSASVVQ